MKTLRKIIDEVGEVFYKRNHIVPEFIGTLRNGDPCFIYSCMKNVAIVAPLHDMSWDKRAVKNFRDIYVWPQDIIWAPRITDEEE